VVCPKPSPAVRKVPLAPKRRYLVVDPTTDGDTPLPSGQLVRLIASYHNYDLAEVLACSERMAGRPALVLDTAWEADADPAAARAVQGDLK
jgi:hypothetical protein